MTIVATGPLTAMSLAESIGAATGKEALAFFDAIAPIVYRDSIDMDICWMASRRSDEHTSEIQSLMRNSHAVFRLKKNNITLPQSYCYNHKQHSTSQQPS